ncbi:MAG: hypothetical protein KKC99_07630, partial [Proteobacteria bacterium]|nr:hypothetical protein [Pseudomonadota bacterium]
MREMPMNLSRVLSLTLLAAILWTALPACPALAAKPLRIAYLEAGEFWLYSSTFDAFKAALAENTEFAPQYPIHVSPGWGAPREDLIAEAKKIMADKEIDLIIAAGTSASRVLLQVNNGTTPIIGIALADPIAAKLVLSAEDSGVDNFTCRVIPNRWKNMFRVFSDVVQFKKLGLIYPKGPEGRLY